jgi:hypothetical protein
LKPFTPKGLSSGKPLFSVYSFFQAPDLRKINKGGYLEMFYDSDEIPEK